MNAPILHKIGKKIPKKNIHPWGLPNVLIPMKSNRHRRVDARDDS